MHTAWGMYGCGYRVWAAAYAAACAAAAAAAGAVVRLLLLLLLLTGGPPPASRPALAVDPATGGPVTDTERRTYNAMLAEKIPVKPGFQGM